MYAALYLDELLEQEYGEGNYELDLNSAATTASGGPLEVIVVRAGHGKTVTVDNENHVVVWGGPGQAVTGEPIEGVYEYLASYLDTKNPGG